MPRRLEVISDATFRLGLLNLRLGLLWLIALASACGSQINSYPNPASGIENTHRACSDKRDNDGDGKVDCKDPECAGRHICPGRGIPQGCGGEFHQVKTTAPNVVLVLDRSGSMETKLGGKRMWDIARASIYQILKTYAYRIRFGMMVFPGTDQHCKQGKNCGPSYFPFGVSDGNASKIKSFLVGAKETCSLGTPTGEALGQLTRYNGIRDSDRDNFILLVTDGKATCRNPVPFVRQLRAQTPSVRTFVVGFGANVDASELEAMAKAGGTPRPGAKSYYQANDAKQMQSAFAAIAGGVLGCTYTLSTLPPSAERTRVFLNHAEVKRDKSHKAGWDYNKTANQLLFYGATCTQLKSGKVKEMVVVYGCGSVG